LGKLAGLLPLHLGRVVEE